LHQGKDAEIAVGTRISNPSCRKLSIDQVGAMELAGIDGGTGRQQAILKIALRQLIVE
jgi:hypothetical protein